MAEETLEAVATDDDLNAKLAELSQRIYGGRAALRLVDPKSIVLLKKNARFMKKKTFDQLSANVTQDGMLSSVPLCQELRDGSLEALSGNHRVKASIKAGFAQILVLVIPECDEARKVAIQLSHNALVGEDDKQTLADLWAALPKLDDKLYSGLDSDTVAELEKISFSAFNAEPLRTQRILLWFLPEEVESLDALLDGMKEVGLSDPIYMVPAASYKKLFDALVKTKKVRNIKNTAVAMAVLIERLVEVADWLEEEAREAEKEQAKAAQPPEAGEGEGS